MKVGAAGGGKAHVPGELCKMSRRIGRLLPAHDLDRGSPRVAKLGRECPQPGPGEPVLGRMLVAFLSSLTPRVKSNIFAALSNIRQDYLLNS